MESSKVSTWSWHTWVFIEKYVVVSLLSFFCLCETKTKCYLEAEILKTEISDGALQISVSPSNKCFRQQASPLPASKNQLTAPSWDYFQICRNQSFVTLWCYITLLLLLFTCTWSQTCSPTHNTHPICSHNWESVFLKAFIPNSLSSTQYWHNLFSLYHGQLFFLLFVVCSTLLKVCENLLVTPWNLVTPWHLEENISYLKAEKKPLSFIQQEKGKVYCHFQFFSILLSHMQGDGSLPNWWHYQQNVLRDYYLLDTLVYQ